MRQQDKSMTENAAKLKFANAVLSIPPTTHPTNVLFRLSEALTEYEKDQAEIAVRKSKKAEKEKQYRYFVVNAGGQTVKSCPDRPKAQQYLKKIKEKGITWCKIIRVKNAKS